MCGRASARMRAWVTAGSAETSPAPVADSSLAMAATPDSGAGQASRRLELPALIMPGLPAQWNLHVRESQSCTTSWGPGACQGGSYRLDCFAKGNGCACRQGG